jgi:hypothetical protein
MHPDPTLAARLAPGVVVAQPLAQMPPVRRLAVAAPQQARQQQRQRQADQQRIQRAVQVAPGARASRLNARPC